MELKTASSAGMAPMSWAGGVEPFGMSWQKLMMWIFIVTDGLLFAGFLASYGFARTAAPAWPDQQQVFHLWFISLMTFVLISSSATMATAVAAARLSESKTVARMVLLTLAGGTAFLGMQAYEWTSLIREGVTLGSNPWNVPSFGNYFFLITGFHGTHVLIGTIVLAAVFFRSRSGKTTASGVELAGLYWHFVDLVWVFVFTLFYLV
jgi:cytochrome c oxidase subunit 3